MSSCPFCKILANDEKNQIIMRGQNVTAIRKLYPSKNINFLIISNEQIKNYKELDDDQAAAIAAETVAMAKKLLPNNDWSLKTNNGKGSSQDVFHLHTHVYSGQDWPTAFGSI